MPATWSNFVPLTCPARWVHSSSQGRIDRVGQLFTSVIEETLRRHLAELKQCETDLKAAFVVID